MRLFRNQRITPFDDPAARFAAGRFGMWLLIATLAVIFVATLMAYVVVRLNPANAQTWPPPNMPPLPSMLIVSTALLLLASGTMHIALVAARQEERTVGGWMLATVGLVLAFLVCQWIAWDAANRANMAFDRHLYAWTFYVLTVLHALHVLAGLPPLIVTTARALRHRYGPGRLAGVTYCAMYWHFLDAAWVVLYLTLLWGSR